MTSAREALLAFPTSFDNWLRRYSPASSISMKRIKHLPGSVHNSLHSSVFLFDLTRVVDELVLNSLDAGATKVHVCVSVGACYVKVEDNGFGITRDGLVLLGENCATSKLQNLADVGDNIENMGSRGEALSSLSDISLLEVIAKARGRPNAYRKVMKGRKCLFLGIDEHRQDVGTTVIVRDLFYNQPVRRRSMQSSPKKVLHSVKKCLIRSALMHPQVSFSVIDLESENELLHTRPSSSPLPLVSNNFGSEVSDCLHKVRYSDKELNLSGYLSGPADASSLKAFQYLYINSRFVCRGPVHKLINNLASSFLSLNHWKSGSEFHDGKRQRTQECPAYMLNLHCPLSCYDLNFESSKTVVEFKDWAFVLSFIEQAVWHSWKKIPACSLSGESHKRKYDASIGIEKGDVFTPDTSLTSEMDNKEYGPDSYQNFLCQSPFSFPKELALEDYDVYNGPRRSSMGLNGKITEVKLCRSETNYGHQIDCLFEGKSFNLKDIPDFTHDEIVSSRSASHPWVSESIVSSGHLLSDHIAKVDKIDDHLMLADDEKDRNDDSRWDRSCHFYQSKSQVHNVPFLLRCSRGLDTPGLKCFVGENVPAKSAPSSDHKSSGIEFDERKSLSPYGSYVVGAYCSIESSMSSDSPTNISYQEKFDHFRSSFGSMRRCLDKTASSDLSNDITQFHGCHGLYYPRENDIDLRRANHIIENTFTSRCSYSEEVPGSPPLSGFFMTDDNLLCNVRSEGNHNSFVGLTPERFQTSKLVDRFAIDGRDSTKKSICAMFCKDDELLLSPGGIAYQNHTSHNIKLENALHAEINNETALLNFSFPIADGTSNHNKHPDDFPIQKHMGRSQWEVFQYCQFSHSANSRSRRSHSAPPFYKRKSKFSTISDYSKTVEFKDQQGQYSDDPSTFSGSPCTSKNLSQACGISQSYAMSAFNEPSTEPLGRTSVDVKHSGNEINMVQTNEDFPDMEYSDVNMTKWRSGDKHSTIVQDSARSHSFSCYEDDILDISSGILHLAGGSLVPESICRDSLEDAKVLLQVDRKFIPVVVGGILVAIDQHAADERIRLEELRQKVMSGEGCSITYLDLEQELVLPEIGLQLVQNYGEQIKKWGWICNARVQCSGSFTKNLNLLKKQSCGIKLLAVPCILGIKLTDKDLLEYLEQLADTDGTSTMPPSVLRVLNFKACRGAIMFGDPLLPSECSLIVEELKQTSLCFQCAHGRPTTAPLINMVELHKHLTRLEMLTETQSKLWHGIRQHRPSVQRAQERLSSAKRLQNG